MRGLWKEQFAFLDRLADLCRDLVDDCQLMVEEYGRITEENTRLKNYLAGANQRIADLEAYQRAFCSFCELRRLDDMIASERHHASEEDTV